VAKRDHPSSLLSFVPLGLLSDMSVFWLTFLYFSYISEYPTL
jgi:hypothetical protein